MILYPGEEVQELPVVVELHNPEDSRRHVFGKTSMLSGALRGWIHGSLAPRGTGSTAWSSYQQWNLRRSAALVGRTIASMRVLDTLQGLRAIRQLGGIDTTRLYLAGRGEMAVVALYVALLDGRVAGVLLKDPPATQDEVSAIDGTDMAIEMLHCLKYTDAPYVAGLLWPAQLVFVGHTPATYQWAADLYARLQGEGGWWRVETLTRWQP